LVNNLPESGPRPSLVPHPPSQTLCDIRVLAHDLIGRRAGAPPKVPKKVHDFRSAAYVYRISPLARWIFERLDLAQARALRRRNYHLLFRQLSCFEELTILFGPESGGVSPAFLMIECADPWRSAAALAARGVESYPFWTFYHQHFPFGHGSDAEYLKSHILALPVHQNLKPEDTHRIIEAVRSALEDPNEREALCIHHHAVSK
jgi:dTDP-4-amino-4,6-dideoxygalactose transaminase